MRKLAAHLWRQHASPGRLGLAVGLGVLVGCSPLYGLHSLIGVGLAALLRLNQVALFVGTQVSIAPLAPFVAFAAIQLGALVLTGQPPALSATSLSATDLPRLLGTFGLYWAVGGLLIGLALGSLIGLVVALAARRRAG